MGSEDVRVDMFLRDVFSVSYASYAKRRNLGNGRGWAGMNGATSYKNPESQELTRNDHYP